MKHVPFAACAHVLLAAWIAVGCAPAALEPDRPLFVSDERIAPFQILKECVRLQRGDRLEYEYTVSEPVNFSISYREGGATIAPVVRDRSREDLGIFPASLSSDYCLTWEAGAAGAMLDYRLRLRRPAVQQN